MMRILLKLIASGSSEKYKVGALYIKGLKWSIGYNTSADYGSHAEDHAISNFEKKYGIKAESGTMYCTYSPCSHCTITLKTRNMRSKYVSKYTGKL